MAISSYMNKKTNVIKNGIQRAKLLGYAFLSTMHIYS